MSKSVWFVLAIGGGWATIGLILSIVMGRRGHNSIEWLVLGTLLGPLALVLAFDARRHDESLKPATVGRLGRAPRGRGPVDVLIGYDASPQSVAAIDAVGALLGDRMGRMTIATVVSYGDLRGDERQATADLARIAKRLSGPRPDLRLLHGHPAAALDQCAIEGGYDLIAVGTRGTGVSKAILGSAASELAHDSKVPVLLVSAS
jgi:nucleotide-binding universal stress UspA family protein